MEKKNSWSDGVFGKCDTTEGRLTKLASQGWLNAPESETGAVPPLLLSVLFKASIKNQLSSQETLISLYPLTRVALVFFMGGGRMGGASGLSHLPQVDPARVGVRRTCFSTNHDYDALCRQYVRRSGGRWPTGGGGVEATRGEARLKEIHHFPVTHHLKSRF